LHIQKTTATRVQVCRKAIVVITNTDGGLLIVVGCRDAHFDLIGLSMFENVGKGLLDNMHQLQAQPDKQ